MTLALNRVGMRSKRARKLRRSSGFSLVEVMLVMSIMMLIAAIAIPRMLDAQRKAYEAGVVTFLRAVQSNQESYRLANGSYADNFTDLGLVAFAPVAPGGSREHNTLARLIAPLEQIGPVSVYAAQASQQPPEKTPPPPDTGQQGTFGGKAKRSTRKSGGTAGAPDLGGSGSTGGGAAQGGAGAGGQGVGRPRKGAGAGAALGGGGTPLGGSSGAPAAGGGSNAPQTGGAGAPLSGPPAPGAKTNIVLKHNYIFTLVRPTPTTWSVTAAPVRDRGTSKFYYFDQTGVIRVKLGRFAGSASPQL